MIRKTLTIFSLTGLLLSVGLWGVSYFRIGYHILPPQNHTIMLAGGTILHYQPSISDEAAGWRVDGWSFHTTWLPESARFIGGHLNVWWIPLWIPSVLFLVLGMSCVVPPLHRCRERQRLGLCLKCGYDLRASKDRCPECGEEFGSTGVRR